MNDRFAGVHVAADVIKVMAVMGQLLPLCGGWRTDSCAPISVVRQSRCVGHGFPEADVRKPVTTGGELVARLLT